MSEHKPLFWGILTTMLIVGFPGLCLSEEGRKPEIDNKKTDPDVGDGVQQYCANIANIAADARIAWEMKRLNELDAQMKRRIAELETKEAEAKEWVGKRENLMKKAEDGVVAIYAKMQPGAAAAQMIVMEEAMAAALLGKLNPRVSGAILNEMEPGKAARLTGLMSGLASDVADRKKS
jgi:flagellar motility protein MotE (MotC chaperone)